MAKVASNAVQRHWIALLARGAALALQVRQQGDPRKAQSSTTTFKLMQRATIYSIAHAQGSSHLLASATGSQNVSN